MIDSFKYQLEDSRKIIGHADLAVASPPATVLERVRKNMMKREAP